MDDSQGSRTNPSDLLRKPIVGEDGVNPFADSGPAPAETDNLYHAPASDDGPVYQPTGYVPTLVPRSRRIFRFGLLGLVVSIVAAITLAAASPYTQDIYSQNVKSLAGIAVTFAFIAALADLALTVGACVLGVNELKAIKAGAVSGSDRRETRRGMLLGLIGTLLAVASAASFIYQFILPAFFSTS
jgi:hypothetical protein